MHLRLLITAGLLAFSLPSVAWVVLDVRHYDYGDRLRVVIDLDRNLAVTQSIDYQSITLGYPETIRRFTCPDTLPPGIELTHGGNEIRISWQGSRWAQAFQLVTPARQVIDLYTRVGKESVPNTPRPALAGGC